jgi:sugar lactone lactonase YvrE
VKISIIHEGKSIIGEAPVWDAHNKKIYWIDNQAPNLHCYDIAHATYSVMHLPAPLCCLDLKSDHKLIAVMGNQFIKIDPKNQSIDVMLAKIVNTETLFNDGKLDAAGRLWVGSMDPKMIKDIGNLYCIDENLKVSIKEKNIVISNGLGWSPDNKIFYHTDTIKRTIYKYDFCLEDGTISNKNIFVTVPDDLGYPDGLYVDREGFVWSAHWRGARVTCYAPNSTIDRVIKMPTLNITSCCIAEDKLFVTTASFDFQGSKDLGQNAGCFFMINF